MKHSNFRIRAFVCGLLFVLASCAAFHQSETQSSLSIRLPEAPHRAVQMQDDIARYAVLLFSDELADAITQLEESDATVSRYLSALGVGDVQSYLSENAYFGNPGSTVTISDVEEGSHLVFLLALGTDSSVLAFGYASATVVQGQNTSVAISLHWTNTAYRSVSMASITAFADTLAAIEASTEYENIYLRFKGEFSSDGKDGTSEEIDIIRSTLKEKSRSYALDFSATTGLTTLNGIGDSTTEEYTGSCFFDCDSIEAIVLPASLTSIGNAAFANCDRLARIFVDSGSESFVSEDGIVYNKAKTTLIAYPVGRSDTSFSIPSSVKIIGNSAFFGAVNLSSVTIPPSVTNIRYCAFRNCTALTSITLPDSVSEIRDFAFRECSSLTSVTIGSGAEYLMRLFWECDALTTLTIAATDNWYMVSDKNNMATKINGVAVDASVFTPANLVSEESAYYKAMFYRLTESDIELSQYARYNFVGLGESQLPDGFLVDSVSTVSDSSSSSSIGVSQGVWNLGGAMIYSPRKDSAFKVSFNRSSKLSTFIFFNGNSGYFFEDRTTYEPSYWNRYISVPTYNVSGEMTITYGVGRGSSAVSDTGVIAVIDQEGNIIASQENLPLTTGQASTDLTVHLTSSISSVIIVFSRGSEENAGGSLQIYNILVPSPQAISLDGMLFKQADGTGAGAAYLNFKEDGVAEYLIVKDAVVTTYAGSYTISALTVQLDFADSGFTEPSLTLYASFGADGLELSDDTRTFSRYYGEIAIDETISGTIRTFSVDTITFTYTLENQTKTYSWTKKDGTEESYDDDVAVLTVRAYDASQKEITATATWDFEMYENGFLCALRESDKNVAIIDGWNENQLYQLYVLMTYNGMTYDHLFDVFMQYKDNHKTFTIE